jgi:hypothetical protein
LEVVSEVYRADRQSHKLTLLADPHQRASFF